MPFRNPPLVASLLGRIPIDMICLHYLSKRGQKNCMKQFYAARVYLHVGVMMMILPDLDPVMNSDYDPKPYG